MAFKTLWNLVSTLFSQTSATLYSHIVHFQLLILSFAIFFCAGLQCPAAWLKFQPFSETRCSIYLLQGVSPPSVEGHNTSFSLHSYSAQERLLPKFTIEDHLHTFLIFPFRLLALRGQDCVFAFCIAPRSVPLIQKELNAHFVSKVK